MKGEWLDRTVQEIWLQQPGMGVRELQEQVTQRCKEAEGTKRTKHCNEPLLRSVVDLPPPIDQITRSRIRQAKQWIPFRYVGPSSQSTDTEKESKEEKANDSADVDDSHSSPDADQMKFVTEKLQQRVAYKATKMYKELDSLHSALVAMGVQMDERTKTWSVGKSGLNKPDVAIFSSSPQQEESMRNSTSDATNAEEDAKQLQTTSWSACTFCGKTFPSRNIMFKHLRDPTSGCGNAIFVLGEDIPDAPSQVVRKRKQENRRQRRVHHKGAATALHSPAEHCLWVGDLPCDWTLPKKQHKNLRALFSAYLPRDVLQPWIKRVVRKAYRKETADGEMGHCGYAIVVFRDAEEARACQEALDKTQVEHAVVFQSRRQKGGEEAAAAVKNIPTDDHASQSRQQLPSFVLKVKQAEKGDIREARFQTADADSEAPLVSGQDPPLEDQLRPLGLDELKRRVARLEDRGGSIDPPSALTEKGTKKLEPTLDDDSPEATVYLQRLAKLYKKLSHDETSRPTIHRTGRSIPDAICNKLLDELQSLRWPARNDRRNLAAERYLVLQSRVDNDRFYNGLRDACLELMDWVDPQYYYSGVAVTKNFVASPHIDHRDESFQYAVCLGPFQTSEQHGGGELCVEGQDAKGNTFVNVVDTHNRIARVDGRHVHWVRTWEKGDRFSLIFYDTSNRKQTPIIECGVDEAFLLP